MAIQPLDLSYLKSIEKYLWTCDPEIFRTFCESFGYPDGFDYVCKSCSDTPLVSWMVTNPDKYRDLLDIVLKIGKERNLNLENFFPYTARKNYE
jgi:hypothetical protein